MNLRLTIICALEEIVFETFESNLKLWLVLC